MSVLTIFASIRFVFIFLLSLNVSLSGALAKLNARDYEQEESDILDRQVAREIVKRNPSELARRDCMFCLSSLTACKPNARPIKGFPKEIW